MSRDEKKPGSVRPPPTPRRNPEPPNPPKERKIFPNSKPKK